MYHALLYKTIGHEAFINMTQAAHEYHVFLQLMEHKDILKLTSEEIAHSEEYVGSVMKSVEGGLTTVDQWRKEGLIP